MDITNIRASATGSYSGSEYEENVTIPTSAYMKFKEQIDGIEISICELDGKYSECEADIEIQQFTEDKILNRWFDVGSDGEHLYDSLFGILKEDNISLDKEIKKAESFVDSLDTCVTVEYSVRKSQVEKIKEFIKSINN